MGAEVTFKVRVLRLIEEVVEVDAVRHREAMQKVRLALPDVVHVEHAWDPRYETDPCLRNSRHAEGSG